MSGWKRDEATGVSGQGAGVCPQSTPSGRQSKAYGQLCSSGIALEGRGSDDAGDGYRAFSLTSRMVSWRRGGSDDRRQFFFKCGPEFF